MTQTMTAGVWLLLLTQVPARLGQDTQTSTSSPRDAFLQAISEQVPDYDPDSFNPYKEQLEDIVPDQVTNPFRDFDREPQAPPPTLAPGIQPMFPTHDNNRPSVFEPPSQDFRPAIRVQVDDFGNPLADIHNTDTTRYELGVGGDPNELRCPRNWVRFQDNCYKFNRSPRKQWSLARELCVAFKHDDSDHADLASIDSFEEHRFITEYLNKHDPQHRRWYISTKQEAQNQWINADGTQMMNLQDYFLDSKEWGELAQADYKKDFLVYAFSLKMRSGDSNQSLTMTRTFSSARFQ